MNPADARTLVPPRPNLGPEPWTEPDRIGLYSLLGAVLASLLVAWFAWKRLARTWFRKDVIALPNSNPPDTSTRGRLFALSQSMRNAMASQFGAAWRAKTNEELSAEPRLAELLGLDPLQEMIQILNEIDRLKFAPNRSDLHQESLELEFAAWEPRIAEFQRKIKTSPERQRKNGSPRPDPRKSAPCPITRATLVPQPRDRQSREPRAGATGDSSGEYSFRRLSFDFMPVETHAEHVSPERANP